MSKKKLLLHQCCAICTAEFVKPLLADYEINALWFNPNIHPLPELEERAGAAKKINDLYGIKTVDIMDVSKYDPRKWLYKIPRDDNRHYNCYKLRLVKTVKYCLDNGYTHFSTTLLASPHQQHDMVKEISQMLADHNGVNFVYRDSRSSYYEAKKEIKKLGLYSQKYCGCVFSKEEREKAGKQEMI